VSPEYACLQAIACTVKLRLNGPGYNRQSLNTDFFGPGCFLLISMYDDMVKTDSGSTDFRLLRTSLSVPTLETMLDTADRLSSRQLPACLRNCNGRLADRTSVIASWFGDHVGHQPFLQRSCQPSVTLFR